MADLFLDELVPSAPLPADHDPLAAGILMLHQRAWLEDPSPLKVAVKGRRTGVTYAEALDDTLIAASSRTAGGDNIYYMGDTKEKGLEFIRYVGHFARIVARELAADVQEFLFADEQEDGSTKHIQAYRVSFASGFQVVALSSNPANIRGLQGIVVIDEAAFHKNVAVVLDAVNALLIWGGKIRIISTHNGEENPFNLLIRDIKAGLYDYSIHTIPFSAAVRNGLYERVCLMKGWTPTAEGMHEWLGRILRSYGPRIEARNEELEAIARKGSGVYLPRSLVQKAQEDGVPAVSLSKPAEWYLDEDRLVEAKAWFAEAIGPILAALDPRRRTVFGQDFARDADLSVILVCQVDGVVWRSVLMIEMRRIPFDVQRLILFALIDALPLFQHGVLDARGNGHAHAEAAVQKYGPEKITEFKATAESYAHNFPKYRGALEDRSITLPPGEDIIADHRLVVLRNGNPTMSDQHVNGADGQPRHGDSAIAGLLAFMASEADPSFYAYTPVLREVQALGVGDHNRFWEAAPIDDDLDRPGRRELRGRL